MATKHNDDKESKRLRKAYAPRFSKVYLDQKVLPPSLGAITKIAIVTPTAGGHSTRQSAVSRDWLLVRTVVTVLGILFFLLTESRNKTRLSRELQQDGLSKLLPKLWPECASIRPCVSPTVGRKNGKRADLEVGDLNVGEPHNARTHASGASHQLADPVQQRDLFAR